MSVTDSTTQQEISREKKNQNKDCMDALEAHQSPKKEGFVQSYHWMNQKFFGPDFKFMTNAGKVLFFIKYVLEDRKTLGAVISLKRIARATGIRMRDLPRTIQQLEQEKHLLLIRRKYSTGGQRPSEFRLHPQNYGNNYVVPLYKKLKIIPGGKTNDTPPPRTGADTPPHPSGHPSASDKNEYQDSSHLTHDPTHNSYSFITPSLQKLPEIRKALKSVTHSFGNGDHFDRDERVRVLKAQAKQIEEQDKKLAQMTESVSNHS